MSSSVGPRTEMVARAGSARGTVERRIEEKKKGTVFCCSSSSLLFFFFPHSVCLAVVYYATTQSYSIYTTLHNITTMT